MPTTEVDAVLERLDALLAKIGGAPVLAFDADGTLWTGDVTRDLVSFVMSERPLLPDGQARLSAIATRHGVPTASDVYDQLALLVLSYSAGLLPDAAAVESVVTAFAGQAAESFEELALRAIERADLGRRFRPETARFFEWGARRGLPVVVVSASPRAAVLHALRAVGLRATDVLGTAPRVEGGRLLAELALPVLVGAAKVDALRAHTSAPVLAAFGDDVRDLPLLSAARLAVAVHPTAELVARSTELESLVVIRP